jgi:hypothetical protein
LVSILAWLCHHPKKRTFASSSGFKTRQQSQKLDFTRSRSNLHLSKD